MPISSSRAVAAAALICALSLSTPTTRAAGAAPCDTPDGRPSVGLALSGGGARGAAHVGVLKVLEELKVPIDCIAGTSMGAIVGGLYAAGHRAEDLEAVIKGVDWSDAFRDDPPRDQLSFRRKQDDYDFLVDFDLGLRGGAVQLPLGVVQGQKLSLLLRRLNAQVRSIDRFDDLPVPFRAVATDAVSGGSVILGTGDLTTAQRASMAAPGVFAPVELDGRVLIDGGVSNNLPINVVRAMGADIVIAVDISFPLLPKDALNSAIALSNQALTILVRREAARQLATLQPQDVAIVPALGTFSSADFSNLTDAIAIGYDTASTRRDELAGLALSDTDYVAWQRAHALPSKERQPTVRTVTLLDDSRISSDTLSTHLTLAPGDAFDPVQLERDIARLYGLNIFEAVDYTVTGSDEVDIDIVTRQKSWGPNFLNFGFGLVDDFQRSSRYAVGVRYTRTQVNPLGGEWRIDFQFGQNPLLNTEFYQPISRTSQFFVAPRINLQRFDSDFFSETGDPVVRYRVSTQEYGVDLGYAINNRSELRAGVSYGTGRTRINVGDPAVGNVSVDGGRARVLYRYDSIDNTAFPTAGQSLGATVEGLREGLGADSNRNRAAFEWIGVRTYGKTHVLGGLTAQSNFGSEGSIGDEYELGGLFQLSGFRTGELRGQHSGLLSLSAYRRVATERLPLPVFAGASVEAGNVWNDSSEIGFDSLRFAGSVFIGSDTPLGPVYLAYGIGEEGRTATYFFLGQRFGSSLR